VPGVFGNILGYAELVRELGDDQPFYALEAVGLDGLRPPIETIETMAGYYIKEMSAVQSQGPYVIIGTCFGATVAYEIARQLTSAGNEIAYLGLIDPNVLEYRDDHGISGEHFEAFNKTRAVVNLLSSRLTMYSQELRDASGRQRLDYLLRKASSVGATLTDRNKTKRLTRELHQIEVARANRRAIRRYRREPLVGGLETFEIFESNHPRNRRADKISWQHIWSGEVKFYQLLAKDSGDMLVNKNVAELGRMITEHLDSMRRSNITRDNP
jgi:thioesterase domain-containing protein